MKETSFDQIRKPQCFTTSEAKQDQPNMTLKK